MAGFVFQGPGLQINPLRQQQKGTSTRGPSNVAPAGTGAFGGAQPTSDGGRSAIEERRAALARSSAASSSSAPSGGAAPSGSGGGAAGGAGGGAESLAALNKVVDPGMPNLAVSDPGSALGGGAPGGGTTVGEAMLGGGVAGPRALGRRTPPNDQMALEALKRKLF